MTELSVNEKYNIITRGLQEVIGDEAEIKDILSKRPLRLYWGTATTGRPHIGYFIQFLKIADYLQAGCHVKILFADLHAFLDNMKSTLEQLKWRTRYYELVIKEVLKSMNIDISRLEFVVGSSYQLTSKYQMDVYKLMSLTTLTDAKHSGAEVVKQSDNPKLTSLVYPLLQVLDEEYLDVDGEVSGVDQRKIFMYGRHFMPKLGYRKRFYFMTPMVPGLSFEKNSFGKLKDDVQNALSSQNETDLMKSLTEIISKRTDNSNIHDTKMSSSNVDSKIDFIDSRNQIKSKINKAYCLPTDVDDNSLLVLLQNVIFPVLAFKGQTFIINRPDKYGGPIKLNNIEEAKTQFKSGELHPQDLKLGIIDALDSILEPIRNVCSTDENTHILKMAYDDKYFNKHL
jgi:tyrosyl-tRNA synthetase